MIKQRPTLARILAMVVFTFSCVGILLFLWLQFGGPIPLRPEEYRMKVAFPEATGLLKNLDVRMSGITIGKVRDVSVDKHTSRTLATLAIDKRYAPISSDAHAILRRKTLLGETFVELSPGSRDAPKLFDNGRLPDGQVEPTVELDEVFQTYDPVTRRAIQLWQQDLGRATRGRGESLNNAFGQLPEFTDATGDLLEVLNRQEGQVRGLFRDTGSVYEALTRDEGKLSSLIVNSRNLFAQTASQRENLAEAFHIFPTFLDETRMTLLRLESFSRNARPLMRDLRPVAVELRPTLVSLRRLSPALLRYFNGFDRQIAVSKRSLPALRQTLDATPQLFHSLGPFLEELNPIFEWLEINQHLVSDFLSYGASSTADTVDGIGPTETGHYLRQVGPQGAESLGIHRQRLASNRGNAYLPPIIPGPDTAHFKIFPNWDCLPANGFADPAAPKEPATGTPASPACFVRPNIAYPGKQGRYLHVNAANYAR